MSERERDEDVAPPRRRPGSTGGWIAAGVALFLGVAGLWLGAVGDEPAANPAAAAPSASAANGGNVAPLDGSVTAGDIRVSNAWVREPAAPAGTAAAYLTIRNTGGAADVLRQVDSGAAGQVTLHDSPADGSAATPDGHEPTGPLTIPAGATVTLAPAKGHIMLEKLTGPLKAGDRVSLLLRFDTAGTVLVEASVLGVGAAAPSTGPG